MDEYTLYSWGKRFALARNTEEWLTIKYSKGLILDKRTAKICVFMRGQEPGELVQVVAANTIREFATALQILAVELSPDINTEYNQHRRHDDHD